MIRKHLHVTCGIIEHNGLVLAVQRSSIMSMPLLWEFPGGKIDGEETPEACLMRELEEELDIIVIICNKLPEHFFCYPDFDITLIPFICRIKSGKIILREHAALRWLHPEELPGLDWAEADIEIMQRYCSLHDAE